LGYKYELGLRLKRAGQYKEAVECFQKAREDAKRKSTVYLELGECFQHIQQYKLAMSNYERAIAEVSERDADGKKIALYRAGVLAFGMRDMDPSYLDQAEKHLTILAGMEFGYKDVSERLDKIAKLRNKE
jgi:tetratricopeptide (TPR) repeat protein